MAKRRRSGGFVPAPDRKTFIQRSRSVPSEEKAIIHNITGAGPSGVKRRFFDLDASDQKALADGLEKLVAAKLKKQGA